MNDDGGIHPHNAGNDRNRTHAELLDVELSAAPMPPLGVVLRKEGGKFRAIVRWIGLADRLRTWIFVPVFMRNHWGMGLKTIRGRSVCADT